MPTASCSSSSSWPHVADDCFVQRHDVDAEAGVGVGIRARQLRHHRAQLLLRRWRDHAGRETADDEDDVRVAHGGEVAAERERARHAAIAAEPDVDRPRSAAATRSPTA